MLSSLIGISEWLSGIVLSLFILMLVMVPTIYLTKGKSYGLYIVFSLVTIAPLVGLGWFPLYIYVIILLLLALGFSEKLRDFLGGLNK